MSATTLAPQGNFQFDDQNKSTSLDQARNAQGRGDENLWKGTCRPKFLEFIKEHGTYLISLQKDRAISHTVP